mmetsp:Transcript_39992/g.55587  ORF Transcript_39992/g.55587 Transcript_39992/m.55587 type:complete len:196 (+) Transcript_39992:109-696(+)|eukprot:CAMPEP_0196582394 /NCGR_PEP_ID=MMETSP1081-20130531/38750_1 /TAXON_ID=36882 /ORGANISM="Pyramimonas amylifera, Strain CCMP720" /LENGTH=195 /DNA_ID=CAMNT_0041902943 /DNA_START=109 /DNA_END=696 /DNA_ORIENTATION=-
MATPILRNVDTTGLRFRLIDAESEVLGRLATHIATMLMGKDKPTYCPNKDYGDVVVVVNSEKVRLTGNKIKNKVYQWHTGYPGGLKSRTVWEQLERKPEEVLKRAVLRMLPKNKLQDARIRKLRLFVGPDHGFAAEALTPWDPPCRNKKSSGSRELLEGQYPACIQEWANWEPPANGCIALYKGNDAPSSKVEED